MSRISRRAFSALGIAALASRGFAQSRQTSVVLLLTVWNGTKLGVAPTALLATKYVAVTTEVWPSCTVTEMGAGWVWPLSSFSL